LMSLIADPRNWFGETREMLFWVIAISRLRQLSLTKPCLSLSV
jgi:hypothetical protein